MSTHKNWRWLTREVLEGLYSRFGNWRVVGKRIGIDPSTLLMVRRRVGMKIWQYPKAENRQKRPNRLDPMKDQIFDMAASGMNCGEIARSIGDDPEQVREFLEYYGIDRQRSGARPGEKNSNWGGGEIVDPDGYILVLQRDHPYATAKGYVRLHRLLMEKKLGRYLLPSEVVHHIDGDIQNNDPENLAVFDNNGDHIRHEWEDQEWREHQSSIRRGRPSRRRIHPVLETGEPVSSQSPDHSQE